MRFLPCIRHFRPGADYRDPVIELHMAHCQDPCLLVLRCDLKLASLFIPVILEILIFHAVSGRSLDVFRSMTLSYPVLSGHQYLNRIKGLGTRI